jgi:hypothetical protein
MEPNMSEEIKNQTREEILTSSYEARIQEVMHYQINIDNYTLALKELALANDPELSSFADKIKELLASEKVEQKKAQIMLKVLEAQL